MTTGGVVGIMVGIMCVARVGMTMLGHRSSNMIETMKLSDLVQERSQKNAEHEQHQHADAQIAPDSGACAAHAISVKVES